MPMGHSSVVSELLELELEDVVVVEFESILDELLELSSKQPL